MKIIERMEFQNKAPAMTFTPSDRVIDAVHAMSAKNYGASIIVDPTGRPVGIVTERDFMRRLLDKGLDPAMTLMSDIMTTDLKMARANDEIAGWLRMMSNERFRHLPVVDDNGVLVNIMSQGDFVSYTWPQLFQDLKESTVRSISGSVQLYVLIGAMVLYLGTLAVILGNR